MVPSSALRVWRAAADRQRDTAHARWTIVTGLGSTGRALALKPAGLNSAWSVSDETAPELEYDFLSAGGASEALVDFMPTFRICAGMQLRVYVAIDSMTGAAVEVPGSSGREDEYGRSRSDGVLDNSVRAHVPLGELAAGRHTLRIRAIDPGVVIDRVSLPEL